MSLTSVDYSLLVVIVVSVLLGFWRGFVKEIISLFIWILVFVASLWFAPDMAQFCKHLSNDPTIQVTAGFLILFFALLIVGMLLHLLLMTLVDQGEFSFFNRFLGGLFGLARGLLFAVIIVIVLGLTSLSTSPAWHDSKTMPVFSKMANWVQGFVAANAPNNIAEMVEQVQKAREAVNQGSPEDKAVSDAKQAK